LLLSPPALALLSSMGNLDGLAIAFPFIGGGVMGVFSGITLGRRFAKTVATKVFAGMAFGLLFGFVTFALGFIGCLAGGFKMDMR
jgi:hypothetical protein